MNDEVRQVIDDISQPMVRQIEVTADDNASIPQMIDVMVEHAALQWQPNDQPQIPVQVVQKPGQSSSSNLLAVEDGAAINALPPVPDFRSTQVPDLDFDVDLDEMQIEMQSREKRQQEVLDDVPLQVKRPKLYEANCVGINQLPELVIKTMQASQEGDWLNKKELQGLSTLLDVHVTGAKVHTDCRKRLYDHKHHNRRNRLSVMMTEDAVVRFMGHESNRGGRMKMPEQWRGMTVFYTSKCSDDDVNGTCYIATPEGMIQTQLAYEDTQNIKSVFAIFVTKLMVCIG